VGRVRSLSIAEITYPAPAGPLPAHFAIPAGQGPWPGVVVVHDALGYTADLRRITDRFAENGYLAMGPALFRRGNRIRCIVSTFKSLAAGEGPAIDDLVAARDHLAADERCTGKVGLIGFCMGGGFCLQLAPRGVFDASAPNYGAFPKDLDSLSRSCPTVASYGARDPILRGAAATLEKVLASTDVPRDIKEYPDVGHSFMNQFPIPGPLQAVMRVAGFAYSEPEAEDSWKRILAFFATHLR
jgi:carboxymethylenebutenolidase